MKLVTLLLDAFGPFTGTRLDLGDKGGPNLHLVHGPNEAGKSSALRAITDLRFGIPMRSQDDFVHDTNKMQIGGVFLDANGKLVGYARRKRRTQTLGRIDLATGQITWEGVTSAADELALNGGYELAEFELMYGLDHERLRSGGKDLLQGQAELSGALFQASSGAGSLSALLEALEADAKRFYNPHGRTVNAVANDAKKQFDEHRKTLREAQVRPQEWQALKRAHDTAAEALEVVKGKLRDARRTESDLTQLRAVAPIVHGLDETATQLAELEGVPVLSAGATQKRLSAEQDIARSEETIEAAGDKLRECEERLKEIPARPEVLAIADAIERFASAAESAPETRTALQSAAVAIEEATGRIAQICKQIAPSETVEAVVNAVPSAPDRAFVEDRLAKAETQSNRLGDLNVTLGEVENDLAKTQSTAVTVEAQQRKALETAVLDAVALGEVASRIEHQTQEMRRAERDLTQALRDLATESEDDLRKAVPLLAAAILSAQKELDDEAQKVTVLNGEDARLVTELAERELRLKDLQAHGEIVTVDTVKEARDNRNRGWALVKQAYVEKSADPAQLAATYHPELPLAPAFESAMAHADGRADMLSADVVRATQAAECINRIEAINKRREQVTQEIGKVDEALEKIRQRWGELVKGRALPTLPPNQLEQWQGQRQAALGVAERRETAKGKLEVDEAAAKRAFERLTDACDTILAALGEALSTDRQPANIAAALPGRIRQAQELLRRINATEASAKADAATRQAQTNQKARIEAQISGVSETLKKALDELVAHKAKLRLPADSEAGQVRARLEEFEALVAQEGAIATARLAQQQHKGRLQDLELRAREILQTIGEPIPNDIVATLELCGSKALKALREAREIAAERQSLATTVSAAHKAQAEAEKAQEKAQAVLRELCADAGVAVVADLAAAELKSEAKRKALANALQYANQLKAATSWDLDKIREQLTQVDVAQIPSLLEATQEGIAGHEKAETEARGLEETARLALQAVDTSDTAAAAREAMEQAAARHRGAVRPWARLRLANALLREAMDRYARRAQAPMLQHAQSYFAVMTDGRYPRLVTDESGDRPVLMAQSADGQQKAIHAMSEGTRDQLYLALRLAALDVRRTPGAEMPLILDDVLITSDDARCGNILKALAKFSEQGQVMIFTHHDHLLNVAKGALDAGQYAAHALQA